ncbi:MAG: TIGR02444 family protein [Stellaceae bacterium]
MKQAASQAAGEFWKFSLAFYALPGVAPACLVLQNRRGLGVNLALYCCWLGISGRGRIDAAQLDAADELIAPWRRDVIEPLRAALRGLKSFAATDPDANALHERVKALELESERICQRRLAALAPPAGVRDATGRLEDASANLAIYLGLARADGAPLLAALKGFSGAAA